MVRSPHLRGLLAVVPATLLLFGCGTQDPAAPTGLIRTANVGETPTADLNEVEVCKVGSSATIEVVSTAGTVVANLADGDCQVVHTSTANPSDAVTLTETVLPANTVLDSIVVEQGVTPRRGDPLNITRTVVTGSNVANVINGLEWGSLVTFYNRFVPPGGGEGCTPGYWKQSQHFDSWTAPYTPNTQFSAVFENAFPGKTLVQVAGLGGGGLNALGRHTVAALLNGASGGVDYDLTAQEVIDAFNAVFPGGDYEGQKDIFAVFNEQGCPLN